MNFLLFVSLSSILTEVDSAQFVLDQARTARRKFRSHVTSIEMRLHTKNVLEKIDEPADPVRGITLSQSTLYWHAGRGTRIVESSRYHLQNLGMIGQYNDREWAPIEDWGSDNIAVGQTSVIGPIADDAEQYYRYTYEGPVVVGGEAGFQLRVSPRYAYKPLVEGTLIVSQTDGQVLAADVTFNRSVKMLPEPRLLKIYQTYRRHDGWWIPENAEWTMEAHVPYVGAYQLRTQVRVLHLTMNPSIPVTVFFRPAWSRDIRHEDNRSIWNVPLSQNEKDALHRLANAERRFPDTSLFRKTTASRGWKFKSLPDARFNRVEGFFAGVDLRLTGARIEPFFPNLYVRTKAGYGFSDDRWKYMIEASRGLFGYHVKIGARYYDDIHHKEVESLVGDVFNNSLTSLGYRYDRFNYFYVKGYDVFAEWKPFHILTLSATYTDRDDDSTRQNTNYGLIKSYRQYDPVVGINEGRLRRVSVEGRWTFGDGQGIRPRYPYHIVTVGIEHTNRDWLKSDFHFTKLYSTYRFHIPTTTRGSLDGKFYGGYAQDALPQQYLFILYGGGTPYVMKTVDVGEFQGNYTAAFAIEHNFGGELLERTGLPLLDKGFVDLIPVFRVGYIRASKKTSGSLVNPILSFKRPFYEAGFAIGDIYRIVRIDVSWRLNQRNVGSRNFGLSATAFLWKH